MQRSRHDVAYNSGILIAAREFVDMYLDALRTLQPDEIVHSPCFGSGSGGVAYTLLKPGLIYRDRSLLLAAKQWAAAAIQAGHQVQEPRS